MKTIEQQIAVMQHFANGGKVEVFDSGYKSWEELENTDFNWGYRDYRIKEKKQTVTIEKWLYETLHNGYVAISGDSIYHKQYLNWKKIKLIDSYEVDMSSTEK